MNNFKIDLKRYKVFINNEWIYGDIKIDYDNEFNKHYYIINNEKEIEVNKEDICKITDFKDKNNNPLYVNDMIAVKTENEDIILIISNYNGAFNIDDTEIYIDGLTLSDFDNKHFLLGYKLLTRNDSITYVGNIIENNINLKEKGENEK